MIKSAVEWLWDISQVRELMAKDFQYAIELEKKNKHIVDANKMIISDEEIMKVAYKGATYPPSFIEGAKWYREQLKK